MFFAITTLITALAMATIAAWFAIAGIMAIFAGMPMFAMIMGIVVEAGKIVGVTWIYRNWLEKTKLKFVMIPVVVVAMLLTSMGIFGLLSKAHLEQTAPVSSNAAKIERLDQRIGRERTEIADAELIIEQLDDTIRVLVDARKISHPTEGSRVVRINQQPQRDQLKQIIDNSFDSIDEYEDEKLSLNQELNKLELEVGPVKYLAALIYEDPDNSLDEAVRIVIIAFIFVFDPMAILLLMAANYSIMQVRGHGVFPVDPNDSDDNDPPGGGLVDLIDVEPESVTVDKSDVEPESVTVDKSDESVTVDKSDESVTVDKSAVTHDNKSERVWMKTIPKDNKDVDVHMIHGVIKKLKHRDRTKEEQKLLERFKKLATSRGIPWDIAKRASVETRNSLLKQ